LVVVTADFVNFYNFIIYKLSNIRKIFVQAKFNSLKVKN